VQPSRFTNAGPLKLLSQFQRCRQSGQRPAKILAVKPMRVRAQLLTVQARSKYLAMMVLRR
jgi:hypothetical protein